LEVIDWDKVCKLTDNKRVLVVGNGDKSVEPEADYVIRMGHALGVMPCDLWVHAFARDARNPDARVFPPHMIHMGHDSRNLAIPKKWFYRHARQYGLTSKPSTGISLILCLLEKATPQSILITGFSGDHNVITNVSNFPVHNWDEERGLIQELILNNRIISSDP
jgi:hypothetical protein